MRCSFRNLNATYTNHIFPCMIKMKARQREVDSLSIKFVIGESTPDIGLFYKLLTALFLSFYFLRSAGFNMMSLAATGRHPSFSKTSSP